MSRSYWSPRFLASLSVGVGCLVACMVAAFFLDTSHASPTPEVGGTTVRMLLESSEMTDVATRSLIDAGLAHHNRREAVHATVASSLKKLTHDIMEQDPEVYKKMDSKVLTQLEKDHVLQKMSSLSDPRVQKLGEDIAKFAIEHQHEGSIGIARRLQEKLAVRLPELRKIRDELLPNARLLKKELTQMRLLKGLPHGRNLLDLKDADSKKPTGVLTKDDAETTKKGLEDALMVVTGLMEQVRVALDQSDFIAESFGTDLKISPFAKSAVGGVDFIAECSECMLRSKENPVKLMMCPMKYASAGADMLECVDNLMGVDNEKFAMKTGEGAAPAQPGAPPAVGNWGSAQAQNAQLQAQPAANAFKGGWTR